MICLMCKGRLIDKLTTFMVDIENSIIIIKNVPSQVCDQCGEISYTHDVSRQIERIVNSLRSSITEIAVVSYPGEAA
ncbi:MAG: type II toxin-antitoxin system MqsA family antitoxin [Clostridiales bacterium]|jgi:YgiT-type zinc finger domain-containing protein|nr:type II toxin-antitoxin system MqsA family antitoxin [Clostridiales bacterium]